MWELGGILSMDISFELLPQKERKRTRTGDVQYGEFDDFCCKEGRSTSVLTGPGQGKEDTGLRPQEVPD